MNRYICPNQKRMREHGFLICKRAMQDGIDYSKKENASTVVCPHQHYCPTTNRAENTENAKECYNHLSSL